MSLDPICRNTNTASMSTLKKNNKAMSTLDKVVYHIEGGGGIYKELLGLGCRLSFFSWNGGRGRRSMSSFFLYCCPCVLRVSHWTWNLWLQLNWIICESSCFFCPDPSASSLGFQVCVATTGFSMIAGELNSGHKSPWLTEMLSPWSLMFVSVLFLSALVLLWLTIVTKKDQRSGCKVHWKLTQCGG